MRVAVCISGGMRTYKKCFDNVNESLFQPFDCDVFLSTWLDDETDWSDVVAKYRPIAFELEKQKPFIDFKETDGSSNLSIISMYNKIRQCNNLKSKHEDLIKKQYDVVVRIRPDVVLNKKMMMDEVNDTKNIYIPSCGPKGTWISDVFAFGSSRLMNLYSDAAAHIPSFHYKRETLRPAEAILSDWIEGRVTYNVSSVDVGTLRSSGIINSHLFEGTKDAFISLT